MGRKSEKTPEGVPRSDLPLTLAIVPALIVSAREQRFAIPQTNLVEMVHLESEQAKREIQTAEA